MRFKPAILLTLYLSVFSIGLNAQSTEIKVFEKKFNVILNSLDSIINKSGPGNVMVRTNFNFIRDKIFSNELPVKYDSTLTYNVYECSAFGITKEDPLEVSLSYGNFLTDKFNQFPCLGYAIIINSFQYAYDFYTKQDLYFISIGNNIENVYFQMNALTLEAIFLSTYCRNAENKGPIENYLINDLKNGLAGSAILFKKTNLGLLHKMDKLKNRDATSAQLLNEFKEIGNGLIKEISFENKSEWENYCSIVTLRTYVFYSQQVIFDIVHLKDNVSLERFRFDDYSDNLIVIDEIRKILAQYTEYFKYQNETSMTNFRHTRV
jgi:hypothetical protein